MVEILDNKKKIDILAKQCIENAKKEVNLIIEFLQIDSDYKILIESAIKRNVHVYIIYKGGYSQIKVDQEKEYFRKLDSKYIELCASEKAFDFNIYSNEDMAIFTSMGLKPYYDNIYFGIKIDRNNDNKIYEDIYRYINSMKKNDITDFGYISPITMDIGANRNVNKDMEIFSFLRGLHIPIITKSIDDHHIAAVFITDNYFTEKFPVFSGLWKNHPLHQDITYRPNSVIDAFKRIIPWQTSEKDIIKLGGNVPTFFIRLDKRKKIDDDVIIAMPNDFRFTNTFFYFKRGDIIHVISKEKFPEFIKKFEGTGFDKYANFFHEYTKKNKDGIKIRTRHGLLVRSITERDIAEFLTDNGIIIQYEPPLVLEGIELHPDFYIQDIGVYLEHWGDDRPNYIEYRRRKEDIYKRHNLRYISTEKADIGNIQEKLKIELSRYINKTDWK